jgi:hypothetical protein
MKSCPSCLAPFKTTAIPTPLYSFSDKPIGQNAPIVKSRALPTMTVNAVLWGISGFLFCLPISTRYHFSIFLVTGIVAFSITTSFLCARFFTLRQLHTLSEKGKIDVSRRKISLLLISAFIFLIVITVLLFTYMPANPPKDWYLFYFIIYPASPTLWSTRVIYYYLWERKNNKQIYTVKSGLWAIPKVPNIYAE